MCCSYLELSLTLNIFLISASKAYLGFYIQLLLKCIHATLLCHLWMHFPVHLPSTALILYALILSRLHFSPILLTNTISFLTPALISVHVLTMFITYILTLFTSLHSSKFHNKSLTNWFITIFLNALQWSLQEHFDSLRLQLLVFEDDVM